MAVSLFAPLVAATAPGPARATVAAAPTLISVSGPMGSMVVDGAGHIFASNPNFNRVEVLNLTTKTLEAPITVGDRPAGLDLSPDGHTLYVANYNGHSVSVVDVATRHELRRITIPEGDFNARPYALAVASNGLALVTTDPAPVGSRGLFQFDLAHETVALRAESISGGWLQASADRSRIAVLGNGLRVYDAATDSVGAPAEISPAYNLGLAMDATGSTFVLNPDGRLLDRDLKLQATIPAGGNSVAMNRAGTLAYRVQDTAVDVLDLTNHVLSATIALPDQGAGVYRGSILSADDSTLVVASVSGFLVVPVSAAVPILCPSGATATVIPVCGAPLAQAVIDGTGHAFVTNPTRNRVEVVNVATGALEAPIPVASLPKGLDFSADGATLYVANAGVYAISVIDVAQRREVRRIPIAPSGDDRPTAIAVAANGTALVRTEGYYGARLLQLDLASGAVHARTDYVGATDRTALLASADRSRIAITDDSTNGDIHVYDSASDTISAGARSDTRGQRAAISGDGSRLLVSPAGAVYDRDLVLRASIPGSDKGAALNRAGTTAYRVQDTSVDVVDLARGLVTGTISLPGPVGAGPGVATLSPDGATLVVLSATGLTIARTAAAVPVPPCTPPSAPAGVTAICGALAEMVMDSGHLYATNPARNQVEVVSLATHALEAPIPVGSQPHGLDLSADGHTLYVANSGASDISIVDLGLRREAGRITVPQTVFGSLRPDTIAVANNQTALVATVDPGFELTDVEQVNLANGNVSVVQGGGDHPRVEASADRSRIAIGQHGQYPPELTVYDAAAGTFTTLGGEGGAFVGLNRDGSILVAQPSGDAYSFAGRTFTGAGRVSAGRGDIALTRSGAIAYSVAPTAVVVSDVAQHVAVRALPLPEATTGVEAGRVALSADESTLAAFTLSGISFASVSAAAPQTAYTIWNQAGSAARDGLGTWIATANDPVAHPDLPAPQYLYGLYFGFTGSGAQGVVGLVADPAGKFAILNVVETNGTAHTAVVPFSWVAGRLYFPLVYELSPGIWAAWVYDNTAGAWTGIGVLNLPAAWGKVAPGSITALSWYGPAGAGCDGYPLADAYFYPAMGYSGSTAIPATAASSGVGPAGGCPATVTSESPPWSHYRVGS